VPVANNIGFKAQLSTKKGSDLWISTAFIISTTYQDALHIPWQFHNSVSQIWDKWNMRF